MNNKRTKQSAFISSERAQELQIIPIAYCDWLTHPNAYNR